jgi:hypothetical protein
VRGPLLSRRASCLRAGRGPGALARSITAKRVSAVLKSFNLYQCRLRVRGLAAYLPQLAQFFQLSPRAHNRYLYAYLVTSYRPANIDSSNFQRFNFQHNSTNFIHLAHKRAFLLHAISGMYGIIIRSPAI